MRAMLRLGFISVLATGLAWAVIPPQPGTIPPGTLVLPAGTPIEVRLETAVSSASAQTGDQFAGLVTRSVYIHGRRAIPYGSILEGTVREVVDRRVATGASALLLEPNFLALPDGRRYRISAEITNALAATDVRVGSEGLLTAPRGMEPQDMHRTELASGGGLVTGAVVAGAQGALIGTGVGAGVALTWWLLSHRHAALNQGAILDVRLDRPVALTPASYAGAPSGPPQLIRRSAVRATSAPVPAAPRPAIAPQPDSSPAYVPAPKPTVQDLPAPATAPTGGR